MELYSQEETNTTPQSFAESRDDLPRGITTNVEARRAFAAAKERSEVTGGPEQAKGTGSRMVQQDKPKPVHKPTLALSYGPDGASYAQRLAQEKSTADRVNRRAARKAEYVAARSNSHSEGQTKAKSVTKAFDRSAGGTVDRQR